MITQDLNNNIINLILKKIKKIKYCEGIIFTGSRYEGNNTLDSDYDFYVLLNNQGKTYNRTIIYKGILLEIFAETRLSFQSEFCRRDILRNPSLFMVSHGKILFDLTGNLHKLQSKAHKIWNKGPLINFKKIKKYIDYELKNYLDDLKSLHILDKEGFYLMDKALFNIIEYFCSLYQIWFPLDREVETIIKRIDKGFYLLYKQVHLSINTNKINNLIKLIKYLADKFELPLTGKI